MLRSSLRTLSLDTEKLLAASHIAGNRRAEELAIAEFANLAHMAEAMGLGEPPSKSQSE
jgi:16S rRNA A1518/A1519 N6-dimethyltransferase RsmA/KsgA/DIM1 with predicted DNA glycosylase/AP lyase activity